jgi:hypothetical protein
MPKARARRSDIDRYFTHPPDPADLTAARLVIAGGILGAIADLVVMAAVVGLWVIGLPLLAACGVAFYRGVTKEQAYRTAHARAMPKPNDAIVDEALARSLLDVEERGLARLELTADDLELESGSWDPVTHLTANDDERLARKPYIVLGAVPSAPAVIGLDGVWRFAQYEVLVICPTDYHLALYGCVIDLRMAGFHQEETSEYHYSDVVAVVTTTTKSAEFRRPIDLRASGSPSSGPVFTQALVHEFQLIVSSGHRRGIVFDISDRDHPDRRADLPLTNHQQVIRAVRRMLRDKKSTKDTL